MRHQTCPPHFFIIPPGEYTGTCKKCGLSKEFMDFGAAWWEKIMKFGKSKRELKMWREFQFPRTKRIVQPAKRVLLRYIALAHYANIAKVHTLAYYASIAKVIHCRHKVIATTVCSIQHTVQALVAIQANKLLKRLLKACQWLPAIISHDVILSTCCTMIQVSTYRPARMREDFWRMLYLIIIVRPMRLKWNDFSNLSSFEGVRNYG